MTISPECSHPKLQSVWALVQNLNPQMPLVTERWQKSVSQERYNTKGGSCLNWQPLTLLSYMLFQMPWDPKETNKQTNDPSASYQWSLSRYSSPSLCSHHSTLPSCISAKQTHVIMATTEGNARSGLWSKASLDWKPLLSRVTFSESGFVYNSSYLEVWPRFTSYYLHTVKNH